MTILAFYTGRMLWEEDMKIQESAENYLETILMLHSRTGAVRSIDIANELNYSKPSISRAMKLLRENDYIHMDRDGYITLTEAGASIAESMFERHNTVAGHLIALGVSEDTAFQDACRIEHVISQETFERIRDATSRR